MAQAVIAPKIRGFICTTSHPAGCAANVQQQIAVARASQKASDGTPLRVLVLGASTGYGLAGRIAATFGWGASTIGVFFERPGEGTKAGSPGWYNTVAFDHAARAAGYPALHINGDAFGRVVKQQTIDAIKTHLGQVDIVVYSLAAPRRTDPATGAVYSSVLKPIGETYTQKTVDLNTEAVTTISVAPASDDEIAATLAVMGGDDLRLWGDALLAADALAPGANIVPLSYIGPSVTQAIYREGTIGRAKEHLEQATRELDNVLKTKIGGRAVVSVNKAVVTQASAAIPTVPLYYSVLSRILAERGEQEEPIHQMVRLFQTQIGPGQTPTVDDEHRIRLDDHEMAPGVQAEVMRLWPLVNTENLRELTLWDDYKRGFRNLFGFEVAGVDYETPVEVEASLPLL